MILDTQCAADVMQCANGNSNVNNFCHIIIITNTLFKETKTVIEEKYHSSQRKKKVNIFFVQKNEFRFGKREREKEIEKKRKLTFCR